MKTSRYFMAAFLLTFSSGCSEDEVLQEELTETHASETITTPTSWSGTHLIEGGLTINAALTLAPCTILRIEEDIEITVASSGALIADGTAECPIVIESAKATPAPGDWGQINIYSSSDNSNLLRFVHVRHGGGHGYGAIWIEDDATITISNTTFHQNRGYGIMAEPGAMLSGFVANTFTDTTVGSSGTGYPIQLGANEVGLLSPVASSGNAVERIDVVGDTVSASTTWQAIGVPYEVAGFSINSGILTVSPGVSILVKPDEEINIADGGVLRCEGTEVSPVSIASSKPTPAAGDWGQINLYDTAGSGNLLRHTTVNHGGGHGYGQLWIDDGISIELDHATLELGTTCDIDDANDPPSGVVDSGGSTYTYCP